MDVQIEVKRIAPQNVPTIHVRTRPSSGIHRWLEAAYRAILGQLLRRAALTLE